MKKILIVLVSIASLSLIILGLFSFNIIEIEGSNRSPLSSTALPKVKVKPFLSENELYQENITKGDHYKQKGYNTLAIQAYTLANQTYPGRSEPYEKIGLIYFNNNNAEKAEQNLQKAIEIDPENANARVFLSKQLYKNGSTSEALRVLAEQKTDLTVFYSALIDIVDGKFEEARTLLESIQESSNESVKKNVQTFLKSFENFDASRGAPSVYLQTLIARNLTEVEAYELAIPMLEKVLEEKNNYRDAWILLGYSYLNDQKPADAVAALTEALKLSPEKPETRYLLSLAYFYNQNLPEAIDNMEVALQNNFEPKKEALNKLGEMYLMAEQYESAADSYEKLLEIDDQNIDIFIKPVWIYLEHLNNPDQALTVAEKALELYPNEAMSHNLVGWVYTEKGEFSEAKTNLDAALAIDPNLDAAHLNLGLWHEKQNHIEEAKSEYKIAYEKGMGNSIANLAAIKYNNLIRNPQN